MKEAAHYLGVPVSTIRAWSLGQSYASQQGSGFADPLIVIALESPPTLSFWNLVELYVLASIRRRHKVSLQRVRKALAYVTDHLGVERPLVRQTFYTDGADLFVEGFSELVNVSAAGQMALRKLLIACLQRIGADEDGLASLLHPWRLQPDEPKFVEINPKLSFGKLLITGTGIPTEVVAERFWAGDSVSHLVGDYGAAPEPR